MKTCSCHCSHVRPTQILRDEHRVIERVLNALERFAAQPKIDGSLFRSGIDFLRNFADGCHHAKEENELFPRLENAGVPHHGGPIGCMLDEHARGRTLIDRLDLTLPAAADGQADAVTEFQGALADYLQLLRAHIWKEDNVLFDLADRTLSPDEQQQILRGFEDAEQSESNTGKHERFLHLADELHHRSQQLACPVQGAMK